MKEELHNKEIKDLTNHVKHLNTLDDFDKLNYLKDLQEKDIEFEIRIDNDAPPHDATIEICTPAKLNVKSSNTPFMTKNSAISFVSVSERRLS